jgi:S1-C subfamily serine protease
MKSQIFLFVFAATVGGAVALAVLGRFFDSPAQAFQRPFDNRRNAVAQAAPKIVEIRTSQRPNRVFSSEEQTNISVYEGTKRSVVNIDTSTVVNLRWLGRSEEKMGSGSGWVLDKTGHIVTNHHVVAGSDIVTVSFGEGEAVPAEVIGTSPRNDIAVLKVNVDPERLFPVTIGDSKSLRVGQKICAIGNPFGLQRTMTVGIVSSLDRSLKSKEGQQMRNIVQIDAALNQGNSGGPLLDSQGDLVGMNTAIASLTGENTGVGFAVPARTILRVVPQLIEYGRFRSAWLGVDYFWKSEQGIGIAKVTPGGPADQAGLQGLEVDRQVVRFGNGQAAVVPKWIKESADIILQVDQTKIESLDDFQAVVESKDPGDSIEIEVLRAGEVRRLTIQLGEER